MGKEEENDQKTRPGNVKKLLSITDNEEMKRIAEKREEWFQRHGEAFG